MQRLEVSGAVRLIYRSLGVKGLNAQLNPICHLLGLLGAHHIVYVSRVRVNVAFRCNSVHKMCTPSCLNVCECRPGCVLCCGCNDVTVTAARCNVTELSKLKNALQYRPVQHARSQLVTRASLSAVPKPSELHKQLKVRDFKWGRPDC